MQPENAVLPEDFGPRLRWFRNQRNLTQADLGKSVSRTATSISEWEKGESEPTLEQIIAMAKLLEVDPARLAFGARQMARVEEAPAAYGSPDLLRDIEAEVQRLRTIAGDDVGRLGWLREELRAITARASGQGSEAGVSDEAKRLIAAFRAERASWRAQIQEAAVRAGRDQAAS